MKPQFYILEPTGPKDYDAVGPFASIAAAEDYLRKDGAETFAESDTPLNHTTERRDWASPCHIVEVRKTVKQIPEVRVTCRLETIKERNP